MVEGQEWGGKWRFGCGASGHDARQVSLLLLHACRWLVYESDIALAVCQTADSTRPGSVLIIRLFSLRRLCRHHSMLQHTSYYEKGEHEDPAAKAFWSKLGYKAKQLNKLPHCDLFHDCQPGAA